MLLLSGLIKTPLTELLMGEGDDEPRQLPVQIRSCQKKKEKKMFFFFLLMQLNLLLDLMIKLLHLSSK